MTINQVIKHFGTKAEVARILKIRPSAISHWVRDNKLPPSRQLEIQKLTKGKLKAGL